jgi:hypothetical protein
VSGHLPPGTQLNHKTGRISGRAPDVDATYTFTIRATDPHGKYADGSFSIDIRGMIENRKYINSSAIFCHTQNDNYNSITND